MDVFYTEVTERQMALPDAMVRLVHFDWTKPVDQRWSSDDCGLLDVCLSPRPANTRVCYEDRWRQDRFEPLGEVVFFPPGEKVRARGDTGRQRAFQCRLSSDALCRDAAWSNGKLPESLDLRVPAIRYTCMRIISELSAPAFESSHVIEALCRLLAIDIVRHFSSSAISSFDPGGIQPWRVKRIKERAALDGPPPSIDELASLCGLSSRHLMRSFKQSRQESIGAYVSRVRLDRAKALLVGGSTVADVAFQLGFAHATSCSTWFVRATGVSPRTFRSAAAPTSLADIPL